MGSRESKVVGVRGESRVAHQELPDCRPQLEFFPDMLGDSIDNLGVCVVVPPRTPEHPMIKHIVAVMIAPDPGEPRIINEFQEKIQGFIHSMGLKGVGEVPEDDDSLRPVDHGAEFIESVDFFVDVGNDEGEERVSHGCPSWVDHL